jgi:DNA-binding PadR family transcriptional regulator
MTIDSENVVYRLTEKGREYLRLQNQVEASDQAQSVAFRMHMEQKADSTFSKYIAAHFKWLADSNAFDSYQFKMHEYMDAEKQSKLH